MELSFYQVVRFAPNIMVGNTILLKHVYCSCAIAIEKLFENKSSKSLYTNLMISGKSTALVDDVRIKGVSLTGSEGMEQVWQQPQVLKKICSIRTWGSDSFIVLEDADIDKTIEMQ
jgi:succinate-semialdehyde dehydrogenase/glutarate-semialdehyde dehydrogenase